MVAKNYDKRIKIKDILIKGNRIDNWDFESLNLHLIPTRKEVKNTKLTNIVTNFEDRYLCLVNLSSSQGVGEANLFSTHLVVFKKHQAKASEAKKKISKAAQQLLSAAENHISN